MKRVIVGISHCHDFSAFPSRMPRNAFDATTIREFNGMVSQGATCRDIVMKHNVFAASMCFRTLCAVRVPMLGWTRLARFAMWQTHQNVEHCDTPEL